MNEQPHNPAGQDGPPVVRMNIAPASGGAAKGGAPGAASAPAPVASPGAPPSLADRLGEVRVGLRADLQVSRHLFRGQPSYIIRDPVSFDTHRLSPEDYQVLIHIRHDQPLETIFQQLVASGRLEADEREGFYNFIVELHRSGFLSLPIVDSAALNRRRLLKRRARLKQLLLSPVFMKLPGINPDAFLDRTVARVGWLFTRGFFALWLGLMAFALMTLWRNADRLGEPLNTVLVAGNLPLLWLTLIGLKLLHELGHAYACKSFGGRVPEMGVFLIALTPCAFVDASDSWSFTSRRRRLAVCMAGMYVELTIAAVAIIVWSLTGTSLLNSLAFNVAMLSSVMTVAFNINPLMRYDGYYAFSDLVEIPNLRERSRAMLAALVRRLVLGRDERPDARSDTSDLGGGRGLKIFLALFGVAGGLYRIVLVSGIAAMIATKFFLPGLALGALYLGGQVVTAVRKLSGMLLSAKAPVARVRAAVAATLVFALLPAALFLLPLPDGIAVEAVALPTTQREIFAPVEGFVERVEVEPGRRVAAGEPLIRLRNDDLRAEGIEAAAAERGAALRVEAAMMTSPIETELRRREAAAVAVEVQRVREKLDRQTLRAPVEGLVIDCLPHSATGSYVLAGQPVASVAAEGWKLRFALNADQVTRLSPQPGDEASFIYCAGGVHKLAARVTLVAGGGDRYIDTPELTHLTGGEIPVDPQSAMAQRPYYLVEAQVEPPADAADAPPLMRGMTGRVRLQAQPRPIGLRAADKFRRFLFNLRQ